MVFQKTTTEGGLLVRVWPVCSLLKILPENKSSPTIELNAEDAMATKTISKGRVLLKRWGGGGGGGNPLPGDSAYITNILDS